MAQQTAVEWLVDKLMKAEFINNPNELIDQAKRMEKQQIMDGFNQGYREGWIDAISGDCTNDQDVETFEDENIYYNETYGK